jgi:zinc transport system substrate-binding protein
MLACGLASAGQTAEPRSTEPVLELVTTLHSLEQLARTIGGERLSIHALVPPGASPHTFEPKPSDLVRVEAADWILLAGGGLDDWARRLMELGTGTAPVTTLLELAREGPGDEVGDDPHVWLDPILVRDAIAPALVRRLIALDPEGSAYYTKRANAFRDQLTELDEEIRGILAASGGRHFVAFHNAWHYFAARYGLNQIAVVQEFAGEEPTPRELANMVRAARDARVPAILVEPQLDPRVARTIGAEFGARTVRVDPIGDPSDPERASYPDLMRFNARAFAQALGGAP